MAYELLTTVTVLHGAVRRHHQLQRTSTSLNMSEPVPLPWLALSTYTGFSPNLQVGSQPAPLPMHPRNLHYLPNEDLIRARARTPTEKTPVCHDDSQF